MSDERLKIAVFIDFDNIEIGVKNTLGLSFDIGAVLEAIKERGEIITKVAYSDWKRGDYGRAIYDLATRRALLVELRGLANVMETMRLSTVALADRLPGGSDV